MSDHDPTNNSVNYIENPEEKYGQSHDDFSSRHNRVGRLLESDQKSTLVDVELDDEYMDRHSRVTRSD